MWVLLHFLLCGVQSYAKCIFVEDFSNGLKSNKWSNCACKTELSFHASRCLFSWSLCTIYNFFIITIDCSKYNLTNWVVAFIAGLLEYHRQAQGWERVQEFDKEQVLLVPQGYYVELNFTIHSKFPLLCLFGSYLEIRDGSNQSANFLGEFCGDYGIGEVRSSGRYMWLKFSSRYDYDFTAFYTGRANNETGMEFLSIYM